jgi:glutamyl-tRNA synthetase
MTSQIRVRFAPSPTGSLHIGGVRTALFNYLFARKEGGIFLLRIEDTDQARSEKKYEDEILDSLRWLGLDWDEEVIHQSHRIQIYQEAVQKLLRSGHAYEHNENGRIAIKLRIPQKEISFEDRVHGTIQFDGNELGDFVIQKSDGFPTYHLACVVDDDAQRVTHVIRGDDHISNTPRQIAIYDALGYALPKFAHLPLVFGADKSPLSKRHGEVSLLRYREEGFLPQALLNYLALLGWSAGNNREFFKLEDLTREFDFKQVGKTNACFDERKLKWLNGEHLKGLDEDSFCSAVSLFFNKDLENARELISIAKLYRSRISVLSDLKKQADYFFREDIQFDPVAVKKHLSKEDTKTLLGQWRATLSERGDFSSEKALEACLRETAEKLGVSASKLIHPTRVAVSGKAVTPGIFEVLQLLGKERVLRRLEYVTIHLDKIKRTTA